jgi:hypothetical protein
MRAPSMYGAMSGTWPCTRTPSIASSTPDLVRHVAADAVESHAGQARAHQREHGFDEPAHRLDVRRMAEAADEHEVASLRKGQAGPATGAGSKALRRAQPAHRRRATRVDSLTTSVVVAVRDRSSSRARVRSAARSATCVAGDFRAAAFAQVMQVHRIEHHPRLRCVLARSGRNSAAT